MNATTSRGLVGIAEHLQTYGRNGDTVLVHMTPGEVRGLQALAVAAGGTLTINPHTGLVEASFLKKLLPTLAGIAGTFVGIPPWVTAAAVGGAMGVASGSLKKGLLAGLQAYGGASLAGGLGAGAGASAATKAAGMTDMLAGQAASQAGYAAAPGVAGAISSAAAPVAGLVPTSAGLSALAPGLATPMAAPLTSGAASLGVSGAAPAVQGLTTMGAPAITAPGMGNVVGQTLGTRAGMFADDFAAAARTGIPEGAPGFVSNIAPKVAGMGVMSTASELMKPPELRVGEPEPSNYSGPYVMNDRQVQFKGANRDPNDTSEFQYFTPVNTGVRPMTPEERTSFGYPSYRPPAPTKGKDTSRLRYAAGGETLEDGAFVMDARTVSELGNGSSGAGQDRLKKIGGKPIKGRGDGTSDSIRAKMGGKEARVARDEVKIPAKAVKKLGRGNHSRGADKLYALMDRAKHARSTSERGQDNGLASLFGA
jgi:hypothetical protein